MEDIKIHTAQEAASILRVSLSEIYKLVKTGELVAVRIGRRIAIEDSDLRSFIDRSRTVQPQYMLDASFLKVHKN